MKGPVDPALLRALPDARRSVAILAAVSVGSGVVALVQALSVAWMVTALVRQESLTLPLGLLAVLLVVRGLLAGLSEVVSRCAGHAVSGEVRVRLLRRWLSSTPDDRPPHDAAVSLAGSGVSNLEPYVARYLPALVTAAVVPVLVVIVMLWIDPWSSLILIVTLPLLPFFAALIGMHTAAESDRRWAAMHVLAGHFLDVVRGLPTLVSYGRAEQQVETVAAVGDRHRRASVRALRTAFLSSAALELLATISVAMVAVAVGLRLAHGTLDLQVGLTAILLAPEAYWPIRRVGQEFHNAADGAAVLDVVTPALTNAGDTTRDNDAASVDGGSPLAVGALPIAAVSIDSVSFGYPDRQQVFTDLSLSTPVGPGLTVLTGPSGSGKSTLLDLVAGVLAAADGTISASPAQLATQRPLIMPGTVLDALRLGAPGASEADCTAALRTVGLWEPLDERGGLDTLLGDDGVGLSAGQRTRLALARALLSRAPLVLLDEPTAHVDLADLDALREVVVGLAAGRRVIVATHDDTMIASGDSRWQLAHAGPARPEEATQPLAPAVPIPAGGDGRQSGDAMPTGPAPAEIDSWQQRPISTRLIAACVLGGLSMTAGIALTATSGWLIVEASTQPVVLTLLVAIVGVRAFGIARPVLRYAERIVSHDAALDTLASRRVEVYRKLIPLTPAALGSRNRGDLLNAVVADLDDAVDEQVRVHVPWWSTLIASVSAVLILLFVLPVAAVVVAAGALAAFAVAQLGSRLERSAQDDAVASRGYVMRGATDLVDRLDQVRAVIGPGRASSEAVLGPIERNHRAQAIAERRLTQVRSMTIVMLWIVLAGTVVGVAAAAAAGLSAATVSAPIAALVALAPIALADAWMGLADIAGARARAHQAEVRLARVFDRPPAVVDHGTLTVPNGVLPVTAVALTAAWPDQRGSLGPFTLPVVDAGTCVQVVGPNGTGKSTLLAVLARHLTPTSGTHLLDGKTAAEVRLDDARAHIAVVDDEPHAFAGTIRANLLLASPGAPDEQLIKSLTAVDLGRWLARQPDGLDTRLAGLSGGERSRLSIARAVLSRRRLILLDEPTAHLDDLTAIRALGGVMTDPGLAVVAVSHQPLPDLPSKVVRIELAAGLGERSPSV